MGITCSDVGIQYSVFCSEKKEGETPIMRNPEMVNRELAKVNKFGVRTTWEAMENNIKTGKGNVRMVGYRKRISKNNFEQKYSWLTYQYVFDTCKYFAKGVSFRGLCPEFHSKISGDFKFLGIYSKNRIEWIMAYLGSHANSVTVVTIYDTLGEKAMEYIFKQTELETILIEACNLKTINKLIKENKTNKLKNLIVVDSEDEPQLIEELKARGINIFTFDEIVETGKTQGKDIILDPAKPETICTICYTSGTTGNPKGAMVTHAALESTINCMDHTGFEYYEDDIYLSFLPYAHIMETLIFALIMTHGRTFALYSGNPRNLTEDAKILKPTIMTSVPRVYQRVFEGIQSVISKKSKLEQAIFNKAIEIKIKDFKETGILTNPFLDTLIFKKIRDILGGRMRFMLVGSAPMDPYLMNFLQCAFSCKIVEGYGQTEDCAGVLISSQYDRVCQHLGGPGWNGEVKLVDVDELDYHSTDVDPETGISHPRGELCVRGPLLFKGYLDDEENTKKAIDKDGWLHTGDVAMVLTEHGNAIKIIDRVKNIFKLSQGEYVAPEKLENVLIDSKFVEQIFVYGDSYKNYLVSIIVPNKAKVVEFLKSKNIECNNENCTQHFENEELKKEILKDLETMGRKADFKGFEIIKKIYLSPEPFTVENDLCTPTLKIRRHVAKKYFEEKIKQLYNEKM
jgi:long-chain acyl-CoA synthetase